MSAIDVPSVDVDRTLGDLVAERPARARVFERAGIDYCCHGQRSLTEAVSAAGLDVQIIAEELAAVIDESEVDIDRLDPAGLVDHIESTHHAYLHEELPLLDALAAKVRDVHGGRHNELVEVARLVNELRLDLEPHLLKEERVLFPAIRELGAGAADFPFGTISNPIRVMLTEHDDAGELLARLRATTKDYSVPEDGCASYHMLFQRLQELETDTFRHIHLENNVLFPAVVGEEPG